MSDKKFRIEENPKDLHAGEIIKLYTSVGWGTAICYTEQQIYRILNKSSYVAAAFNDQEECIGFIRALSDEGISTWVPEIVVMPEYQRSGLGSRLLQLVIDRFPTTGVYLEAKEDQVPFFVNNGMRHKGTMAVCSKGPKQTSDSGNLVKV